jgi:2-oxoglutarate dehydrogenase E1 component
MLRVPKLISQRLVPLLGRSFSDNFMSGNNAIYAEQMYSNWLQDRKSVHPSWDSYFSNISRDLPSSQAFISPEEFAKAGGKPSASVQADQSIEGMSLYSRISKMILNFRTKGHYIADIDPLNLKTGQPKNRLGHDFFSSFEAGISEAEYDVPVDLSHLGKVGFHTSKKSWTGREVYETLKKIYCGKIAFQFDQIADPKITTWILERVEKYPQVNKSKEEKLELLDRVLESQAFNAFCERKYSTSKRFGCEGLDSGISGLWRLTRRAAELGVQESVIGMAHRGRLNVLTCVLRKPYNQIFAEFEDVRYNDKSESTYRYSGDVKYHIGCSNKIKYASGNEMIINLLPNPSHLEAVNAVALGMARARQTKLKDGHGKKVLPIIIHGDAALAGQGIIYELQQMERLDAFQTGGSIHVVFNNQVGFTTDPVQARTGHYPTNIAKINNNFVIHVNADEPEEVDFAMELAMDYRQTFTGDVFINLVGYRRPGHNEQDNAQFTQPEMYGKIQNHPPMYLLYGKRLQAEGVLTKEEFEARFDYFLKQVDSEHQLTLGNKIDKTDWDPFGWNEVEKFQLRDTGITQEKMKELGEIINFIPPEFNANRTIKKIYNDRLNSIRNGVDIDWGTAEALAYASLLDQNCSVRLSGEDVERGTFSHRQSVIADMTTFKKFMPLRQLVDNKPDVNISILNSHLSEYGVLGFEYGHSIASPHDLTIWEAQFGDFMNGAQIIIDQFIMTGEKKWLKQSNLVVLLPHGYDGQGPEHSNARMERFLANIIDDMDELSHNREARRRHSEKANAIIMNITNPANFFHAIRRQINTHLRKPLIIFSPKRLLKHKLARSSASEFLVGSEFSRIYNEQDIRHDQARKILICSGQIYYDLLEFRIEHKIKDVAILRMEQLAPFPYNTFEKAMKDFKREAVVRWVSEEHRNFGAYEFIAPRINIILREQGFQPIQYAGRPISATAATGSGKQHKAEIAKIFHDAFA